MPFPSATGVDGELSRLVHDAAGGLQAWTICLYLQQKAQHHEILKMITDGQGNNWKQRAAFNSSQIFTQLVLLSRVMLENQLRNRLKYIYLNFNGHKHQRG